MVPWCSRNPCLNDHGQKKLYWTCLRVCNVVSNSAALLAERSHIWSGANVLWAGESVFNSSVCNPHNILGGRRIFSVQSAQYSVFNSSVCNPHNILGGRRVQVDALPAKLFCATAFLTQCWARRPRCIDLNPSTPIWEAPCQAVQLVLAKRVEVFVQVP